MSLLHQIAITLIPNVGDATAKKLIAYCGSAEAVFKEKKAVLLKIPRISDLVASSVTEQNILHRAEKELNFIEKNNIQTFFYLDKNYPNRLKQCVDSPILLYFKGNADLNNPKVISIVGTRSATEYGKEFCKKFVEDLVPYNVLVVSGLAFGIDIASHKAALDNNLPTVGIIAHGLDKIYPSLHTNIADKMLINGGILTDFISETVPDRENFPKRNRIIAGMADAVVVVEAGSTGGALITAEIANSYNRDVFAVPGRIGDTYSEGCNNLIKTNKAALIQSVKDVEFYLNWDLNKKNPKNIQKELFIELKPEEEILVNIIKKHNEIHIDSLCYEANMIMSKVVATLLNLEFSGIIKCLPGKMYKIN